MAGIAVSGRLAASLAEQSRTLDRRSLDSMYPTSIKANRRMVKTSASPIILDPSQRPIASPTTHPTAGQRQRRIEPLPDTDPHIRP